MVEGPGVLPHYGGPREWGVPPGVADHSPLGPLCIVASHVSVNLVLPNVRMLRFPRGWMWVSQHLTPCGWMLVATARCTQFHLSPSLLGLLILDFPFRVSPFEAPHPSWALVFLELSFLGLLRFLGWFETWSPLSFCHFLVHWCSFWATHVSWPL